MNIYNVLGLILLSSPFVGIFIFSIKELGIKETIIIFGSLIVGAGILALAIALLRVN